ncbi:MAG: helix-turn-helix transcriptional regulator [Firmicutes bacterium]|nr:helix-turn-helix transcriptional regulator [Bacillota bacterium]
MNKIRKNELEEAIQSEMNDPAFARAWAETELEDQIRRMLIEARIEQNLTQEELAARSGIRQSNISRIENGSVIPTLQTLNAIAVGIGKRLKITLL